MRNIIGSTPLYKKEPFRNPLPKEPDNLVLWYPQQGYVVKNKLLKLKDIIEKTNLKERLKHGKIS